MQKEKTVKSGYDFLFMGLYAFAGLGMELVLGLFLEPLLFGETGNYNTWGLISHWILTCVIWGVLAAILIRIAKRKYGFDLFLNRTPLSVQNWLICAVIFAISAAIGLIDWNGFKVMKEFEYNGLLKFIFQYVYYLFESVLVVLIIAFGQKAGEIFFCRPKIPWGGILAGLTWGLAHIFTKGSLTGGLVTCLDGFLYGLVYLAARKNMWCAFPVILLMFLI